MPQQSPLPGICLSQGEKQGRCVPGSAAGVTGPRARRASLPAESLVALESIPVPLAEGI